MTAASVVSVPHFIFVPDEPWHSRAKCFIEQKDPEFFYPEPKAPYRHILAYCRDGCDVRQECLDFAIDNGEKYGIWGGESERSRRKIARQRRERGRR